MEENKAILEEEISCKLLVTFLKISLEKEGKKSRAESEKTGSMDSSIHVEDLSSLLIHRFPRDHWEDAIVYFQV